MGPGKEQTMEPIVPTMVAEIAKRRAELAPLVEEDRKLAALEVALSGEPLDEPVAARRRTAARAAQRSSRAPRGANREKILQLVGDQPGITASLIAETTGITKATVFTTVSQLKRKGILEARGAGVALPTR